MKKLGIIGGITWQSTMLYYQVIQSEIALMLGGGHSGKVLINSIDFADFFSLEAADNWDAIAAMLIKAGRELEAGGADALMISCNTVHKVASEVAAKVDIPFIHIADAVADKLVEKKCSTVGLMGTIQTMSADFYRGYLKRKHGIDVLVPVEYDQKFINDVIYNEISMGQINKSSQGGFLACIDRLKEKGAEGVILGCTEIPLLVTQNDTEVPVFNTSKIHALAGVKWMLE